MIYTAVLLLLLVVQWSFSIRVYPEGEYVSVVHGSFQAVCVGTMSYFVWLRNGIPVNSTFRGTVSLQSGNGVIELHNILEQDNGTNFRCITEGTPPQASTSVILIVQGLLAAVGSLQLTQTQNSAITLTWTAPFTLDIRGVDPDIVGYTVIVSKITINSSINYTTNETSLLYTLPSEDSACSSYLFTVYARNAVGDGEHSSVQYIASLEVVEMNVSRIGDLREFTLIMSGPVYSGELTFVDLDTNERVLKGGSDLTIAGNTISFTSSGLTPSRRYSVTIVASNIGGSAVSFTTISTHDLVDAMATEAIGGGIELSASYAEDSSASGVLFCFMFVTEDGGIDISRTAFLVVDRTTPPGHTLPFNLHPGCYKTYSYDIGSRGVLSTGMAFPAVTSGLTVRSRDDDAEIFKATYSLFESCEADSAYYSIRVECSQPSNSLATGLQVIVQLTNASEVQKLYSNQSMDPHTPVTVEVERDGLYLVTVFPITEDRGILDSRVEYSEQLEVIATLPNGGSCDTVFGEDLALTIHFECREGTAYEVVIELSENVSVKEGKNGTCSEVVTSVTFHLEPGNYSVEVLVDGIPVCFKQQQLGLNGTQHWSVGGTAALIVVITGGLVCACITSFIIIILLYNYKVCCFAKRKDEYAVQEAMDDSKDDEAPKTSDDKKEPVVSEESALLPDNHRGPQQKSGGECVRAQDETIPSVDSKDHMNQFPASENGAGQNDKVPSQISHNDDNMEDETCFCANNADSIEEGTTMYTQSYRIQSFFFTEGGAGGSAECVKMKGAKPGYVPDCPIVGLSSTGQQQAI